jgi:hypothetical protein
LNIETQRKEMQAAQISDNPSALSAAKPRETIDFTIRCAYTPSKASKPSELPKGGATQTATNNTAATTAPQTARN